MSYSLELEASSSVHINSSAVRAAADAVTRLALDDSLQDRTRNQSESTNRRRTSPSPPPPPPDDITTPRFPPAPSSRSPSVPSHAPASSLHILPRTSPSQSDSRSPQSNGQTSASNPVASSPASRYPSFDQWLTVKESSFNFGASALSPPQSAPTAPRRPATTSNSHNVAAASNPPSIAKAAAAALTVTSNEMASISRASPAVVLPPEDVDDPQQLYMRAVALQQVQSVQKRSTCHIIIFLCRLFSPFEPPRCFIQQLIWSASFNLFAFFL
jgi:hypothetical protein